MDCSAIVVERTYQKPGVAARRALFSRKAIDPDATLVGQLRRPDAGAAEANAAYQKLRSRRSRRNDVSWEDLAPAFDEKDQHAEVAVDWSRGLKDPAIEGELKGVLGGAVDELPADYRTAFLLHERGTIKWRVHRARLFLRRRLADYVGASLDVSQSGGKKPLMQHNPEGAFQWNE